MAKTFPQSTFWSYIQFTDRTFSILKFLHIDLVSSAWTQTRVSPKHSSSSSSSSSCCFIWSEIELSVCQDHVFLVMLPTLYSPAPLLVLIYSLVSVGFFFLHVWVDSTSVRLCGIFSHLLMRGQGLFLPFSNLAISSPMDWFSSLTFLKTYSQENSGCSRELEAPLDLAWNQKDSFGGDGKWTGRTSMYRIFALRWVWKKLSYSTFAKDSFIFHVYEHWFCMCTWVPCTGLVQWRSKKESDSLKLVFTEDTGSITSLTWHPKPDSIFSNRKPYTFFWSLLPPVHKWCI